MTKLTILYIKQMSPPHDKLNEKTFETGYKQAFRDINNKLTEELQLLELYPFLGERLMTLKIYKNKIADVLLEMEKEIE